MQQAVSGSLLTGQKTVPEVQGAHHQICEPSVQALEQTQLQSHNVQQSPTNFSQLPSGFTYDPSKIIGFQNKETNEFALTLLKSQGIATSTVNLMSQASPNVSMRQPQPPQYAPATPSMQLNIQHYPLNAFAVAPTTDIPEAPSLNCGPAPYSMVTGENWMWKTGDLCLAKYWDDGRVVIKSCI